MKFRLGQWSATITYLYSQEGGISFKCRDDFKPSNVMDRWILSFTESLIAYVREEMASECKGKGVRDRGRLVMELV